ncbi:MAG: hypothetical protein J1F35_06105 [Erysipelotrichales bacterium]|nr:hypothetical protein [Erysipelotrichales bacterium]
MEFIDSTGHIFSIKSYIENPIGYDYEINPYIFWLEDEYTNRLSINNYYIRPIRFIADKDIKSITISIENSDFYYLLSPKEIHQLVNELDSLNDYIRINENSFDQELTEQDLIAVPLENKVLIPFYVIVSSPIEGSVITNILIRVEYESEDVRYCPISVGGVFYEENEILIINGQNMGVSLPKEILGAIYQSSYYNEIPDEALYANKIREYLVSYMHLKGQIGNFNSVLDSLKWFGYGDRIEIQKLLQTDNQFQEQFFLDDFTINTDLLHAYKSFRSSTYINLRLWENSEIEEINKQNYHLDATFWGEGKPKFENLFAKTIIKRYNEGDIDFYRSYYDYCFDELGLKLAMLDYYFKKYFLPIHLHIHSTSIAHRVWANDIKFLNVPSIHEQDPLIDVGSGNVDFYGLKNYYIYNQKFHTDTNFNNIIKIVNNEGTDNIISYYESISDTIDDIILYINEPCVRIPINIHGNGFYNCNFILLKDDNKVFESNFQIFQTDKIRYDSLIVIPKFINKELNDGKEIYWLDSNYTLALCINNKWHYHKFNIKVPELQLELGRLVYKYYVSDKATLYDLKDDKNDEYREKWGYEFDHEQYGEDIPKIDNRYKISGEVCLHKQVNTIKDGEVDFNAFMYVPSLVEVNDINFYDKVTNLIYDITGTKFGQSTDIPSNKQVGILTKKDIINKYVSNIKITDITNNGIEFDPEKFYDEKDSIIPTFYFNDFSRDNNQKLIDTNYQIENLKLNIEIGYVSDIPFVSKTIDLVKDKIYNDELLKHEGLPYGVVEGIKFKLSDWNSAFTEKGTYKTLKQEYQTDNIDEELPFIINKCILRTGISALNLNISWELKFVDDKNIYKKSANNIYLKLARGNACTHTDCWLVKAGREDLCCFKTIIKNNPEVKKDYNEEDHIYYKPLDLDTIQKDLIESSINNLINKGISKININNENEFLNRIHIYDIFYNIKDGDNIENLFDNDNYDLPLKYNKDKYGNYHLSVDDWDINYNKENGYKEYLYNLYKIFFNEEGEQYFKWPTESYFDYDFYLMHDEERWYVVFISKMPISLGNNSDLDPVKELEYISPEGYEFTFKHYRSGNNFLINRMYFESSNGRNIFPNNSLAVATVNNVKYPFIIDQGAKWNITPMSLGINKEKCQSTSTANTCIFSIGSDNQKYVRGYYDIDVRYSFDGDVQHQQFAKARFCIE